MAYFTRCLQALPKIDVNDIYRIVDQCSPAPGCKREKGFRLYISSYIHNFEVSKKDPVTGVVCVGLKDSIPVELAHHSCTCVAGSVLCNHCVALLFQSAHYSQLDIPVVPPVLSCTESEQQWHKPRTLGVKPGPVEKMAVMSAKPKQRTMLEE
ncbi:hypothetical protein OJAV_G00219580 [Oryzias javanicus]|uniref:SWIM-type domain-containing protein n=1 Tax=Oryzias javanicus TaxID=123683 RepID=A0A3S2PA91_ORYJA|nr:hypothetical protein OJAV_G00219580 [Oryzias javanicus]